MTKIIEEKRRVPYAFFSPKNQGKVSAVDQINSKHRFPN